MVSLELTVGRWELSFSLGKAEDAVAVVRLSDLSSIAESEEEDAEEASFGFRIVGEPGPEIIYPEDFPPGSVIRPA